MVNDYELIFRHRGASYHEAMVKYPGVRSREFQQLFTRFPLRGGERIVDCPSLGGYLQDNVSVPMRVESLDFCPLPHVNNSVLSYEGINKLVGQVDRAVCLAASHHIGDLFTFLDTLESKMKPGGIVHLADVTSDSSIRLFLDKFVGQWTSTGHSGIWRDFQSLFPAEKVEVRQTPWTFHNEVQMVDFCRLLFGLDRNPTDYQILEALDRYVGLSREQDTYRVDWKLTYVDITVR